MSKIAESISEDLPKAANSTPYDPSFQAATAGDEGEASSDIKHELKIPADLVGCLIGKSGRFINYLRRISNAKITVSERPETTASNEEPVPERLFIIQGQKPAVDKALEMILSQVEKEKARRLESATAPSE